MFTEGGGGQKLAKSCLRSLWMPPSAWFTQILPSAGSEQQEKQKIEAKMFEKSLFKPNEKGFFGLHEPKISVKQSDSKKTVSEDSFCLCKLAIDRHRKLQYKQMSKSDAKIKEKLDEFLDKDKTCNFKLPIPVSEYFKSLEMENENLKKSQQLIEKEIQSLKESKFCKICVNNEINTILLPCGHLVTCNACASSLKNCPMCRRNINDKIRIYMS